MATKRVVSRKDAKARGLKRYYTGKPCKRRHVAERQVCDGRCLVCHRERMREKRANGSEYREQEREWDRRRYAASPSRRIQTTIAQINYRYRQRKAQRNGD